MDGLTAFLLFTVLIIVGFILIRFIRGSSKPADTPRAERAPEEDEQFINHRDPSHDDKL
ncbi:hypothetical protein [Domibacillus robiginosus]|uniref:hypothetical protein n=1 Tax=Domibacillus robiginosus TaxID=1071054 RepID=UPI000A3F98B1|nr:hypothetical protein [Domibacillus robiginosus]